MAPTTRPDWKRVLEGACAALADRGFEVRCSSPGAGVWSLLVEATTVRIVAVLFPSPWTFVLRQGALGAGGVDDYTDATTGEELAEVVVHHLSRRAS